MVGREAQRVERMSGIDKGVRLEARLLDSRNLESNVTLRLDGVLHGFRLAEFSRGEETVTLTGSAGVQFTVPGTHEVTVRPNADQTLLFNILQRLNGLQAGEGRPVQ